jgi:hypothetical protein
MPAAARVTMSTRGPRRARVLTEEEKAKAEVVLRVYNMGKFHFAFWRHQFFKSLPRAMNYFQKDQNV